MFSNRFRGINLLHFFIQTVIVSAILWGAYVLINWSRFSWSLQHPIYINTTLVVILASLFELATRPAEIRILGGLSNNQLMMVSQRQTLFALVAVFGSMVMFKDDSLSRMFLLVFFSCYFLWISWSNRFGFKMLNRVLYRNREKGLLPTLLVGAPPSLKRFADNPKRPNPPGMDIQGFVPLGSDSAAAIALDFPMAGSFADLREICEKTRVKALLLLGVSHRKDLVPPLLEISDELGIRTTWIDDVEEAFGTGSNAYHTDRYSVISHGVEPLENPVNRVVKRSFDLCCSIVGVTLILPPAMLLVAIIQRLNSRGPLFYRQERTGRHGEIFHILKFRSMIVDGDTSFVQATEGDSRIFRGGNFIRKYSIDELPQFVNVFCGQMSMVGPRPHPIALDQLLQPDTRAYRLRNLAKPGITGLAQSRGWRGETREPEQIRNRLKFDVFYIRHWSLALDIRIIVETAWQLIRPPKSAQ